MPKITCTAGAMTPETRAPPIRRPTEVAAEVTGIPAALLFVALHVLPDDVVAVGGDTVTEFRRRNAGASEASRPRRRRAGSRP